jgi:hypothetical protein
MKGKIDTTHYNFLNNNAQYLNLAKLVPIMSNQQISYNLLQSMLGLKRAHVDCQGKREKNVLSTPAFN